MPAEVAPNCVLDLPKSPTIPAYLAAVDARLTELSVSLRESGCDRATTRKIINVWLDARLRLKSLQQPS
jgi:hypothetical protein